MPVANTQDRRKSNRRILAATASVALLGALLTIGGAATAIAAEDGVEDTWDTKFMYGILGSLGLQNGTEPGIDYHERSPLVVPPTRDLPVPGNTAAAAASNPAWPKDPDIAKQRAAKKRVYKNTVAAEQEDMRQLTPAELQGQRSGIGRSASANTASKADTTGSTREEQLTPKELGHTGFNWTNPSSWFDREGKVVPFVKEPDRTSLTEPPVGLRTPSSKYQYGSKGGLEPTRGNEVDPAVGAKNQ